MLNKLKQLAGLINLPVLVLLMSFTVLCFVITKFLQAYFFPKSSKKNKLGSLVTKGKDGNIKTLSRKKRNKKQRSVEIASEQKHNVPAVPVDDEAPVVSNKSKANGKPSTPTIEVERVSQLNKKHDKKKSKSKKKKSQNNDVDVTSRSVAVTGTQSVVEEGEWQTVRSKEQKMQRNKEKRRQEESIAVTPAPIKPAITPYTSTYTSIPSTAKDVAPRFARAAGEEWQEGASKRQSVNVTKSTTIVNRSPMLPAAAQPQPPTVSKWATVTSAPLPADIWENKTTTSIGFSSTQHTWSTNKSNAINWTATVKPNSWASKPTAPAWETAGSPALDQSDWHGDAKSEDWVHVTTPSPTTAPLPATWTTPAVYQPDLQPWTTDVRISEQSSSNAIQTPPKEPFHMEPEGVSVTSVDPEDPWNFDKSFVKEGDWSPPDSHWSNSHDEWNAPAPVTKPKPTYFEESSEDEKVIASTPLQSISAPQTVVGAGSELLQAQNQQTNKKARRRRKKKQTSEVDNDASSKLTVTVNPTIEETIQVQHPKSSGAMDAIDEIHPNDNWTVPKQSKKKKPRARKAE